MLVSRRMSVLYDVYVPFKVKFKIQLAPAAHFGLI